MPDVGPFEIVLVADLRRSSSLAIIALPIFVLREMRNRGHQLDRIERRLNDLDGRRRTARPALSRVPPSVTGRAPSSTGSVVGSSR